MTNFNNTTRNTAHIDPTNYSDAQAYNEAAGSAAAASTAPFLADRIVTGKLSAWLDSNHGPEYIAEKDESVVVSAVTLFRAGSDMTAYGYTFVGHAEVTLSLVSHKTLIVNKVESLKAVLKAERVASQRKCNQIEDQISKLLALDYEGPSKPETTDITDWDDDNIPF